LSFILTGTLTIGLEQLWGILTLQTKLKKVERNFNGEQLRATLIQIVEARIHSSKKS